MRKMTRIGYGLLLVVFIHASSFGASNGHFEERSVGNRQLTVAKDLASESQSSPKEAITKGEKRRRKVKFSTRSPSPTSFSTSSASKGARKSPAPKPSPSPSPSPSPTQPAEVCGTPGWTTLFEDNFDQLDTSKWSFQLYDGWQYGIGDWGNNERVWYTGRPENAQVRDGNLVINARKEANTDWIWQNCWDECRDRCLDEGKVPGSQDLQWCIDGCGWPRCDDVRQRAITSARLRTYKAFSVAPSVDHDTIRIEARISLPKGPGLWPALWALPEEGANDKCSGCGVYGNWPLSGEIDVMEAVNNMSSVLGTIHYGNPWPDNRYTSGNMPIPTASSEATTGFQTYAMEWQPTTMRWTMNGQQYHTAKSNQGHPSKTRGWFSSGQDADANSPFDRRFHLILNLAVGGNLPNGVANREISVEEMQQALSEGGKEMLVDWVRVCGKVAST